MNTNPDHTLTINGQPVEVRELRATDALALLRNLASYAGQLSDADGKISLDAASLMKKLTAIITNTEELTNFLVLKTTGQKEQWLGEISATEYVEVLAKAIELNLSCGIQKRIASLGESVGRFLPKLTTPPAAN